ITARAVGLGLALPQGPPPVALDRPAVHEADGLDLPLRLAALWQQVHAGPLRRTLAAGFFKRDLDPPRGRPVPNPPPPDVLAEVPDPALLAVTLAGAEGLLREADGELHAGAFPPAWDEGLPATVAALWAALLRQDTWNPNDGWRPDAPAANPCPS